MEAEVERLQSLLEDGCEDMQPEEIEAEIGSYRQALAVLETMLRTGRPLGLPLDL